MNERGLWGWDSGGQGGDLGRTLSVVQLVLPLAHSQVRADSECRSVPHPGHIPHAPSQLGCRWVSLGKREKGREGGVDGGRGSS